MPLTQIQRDAMLRAQAGDFSLADAIELLHDDRADFRGEALIGGVTQGGRLRFLVYGDGALCTCCEDGTEACDECDGDGETECGSCGHVAKCEDCGGTGRVACSNCDGTEIPDSASFHGEGWRYVVSLNGDVVFDAVANDPADTPPLEITLKRHQARQVVGAYEAEQVLQNSGAEPVQSSLPAVEQAAAA